MHGGQSFVVSPSLTKGERPILHRHKRHVETTHRLRGDSSQRGRPACVYCASIVRPKVGNRLAGEAFSRSADSRGPTLGTVDYSVLGTADASAKRDKSRTFQRAE